MKKSYFIMGFIFMIYIGLMAYFVIKGVPEKYLFLSEYTLIEQDKGKWSLAKPDKVGKVTVYANENLLGNSYNLVKKSFGYALNDENDVEYSNYSNPVLGYSKDLNIEVLNFKKEEFNDNDMTILKRVLAQEGVTFNSRINSNEKIEYDFDQDGENETIYAASNAFIADEDNVFSVVYLIDGEGTKILFKEIEPISNIYKVGRSYIHSVVDYKKDGKNEIIIGNTYYDQIGTRYLMYQFEKKNINTVFDIMSK